MYRSHSVVVLWLDSPWLSFLRMKISIWTESGMRSLKKKSFAKNFSPTFHTSFGKKHSSPLSLHCFPAEKLTSPFLKTKIVVAPLWTQLKNAPIPIKLSGSFSHIAHSLRLKENCCVSTVADWQKQPWTVLCNHEARPLLMGGLYRSRVCVAWKKNLRNRCIDHIL